MRNLLYSEISIEFWSPPVQSISLITIMGLIGDNCKRCQEAAEAEDGGGLAGRWWRGWANVRSRFLFRDEKKILLVGFIGQ